MTPCFAALHPEAFVCGDPLRYRVEEPAAPARGEARGRVGGEDCVDAEAAAVPVEGEDQLEQQEEKWVHGRSPGAL